MSSLSTMLSSCTSSPFSSITLGDGSSIPIYSVGHAELPSPQNPFFLEMFLLHLLLSKI
jgi:hypothetical protein